MEREAEARPQARATGHPPRAGRREGISPASPRGSAALPTSTETSSLQIPERTHSCRFKQQNARAPVHTRHGRGL